MAKKQSHTQRLIDSMKTLGTARTPITSAYESGKERNILPKDIKSTREVRGQAKRILVPAKTRKLNVPRESLGSNPTSGIDRSGRPTPSSSYLSSNKLSSWNPLKGAWDTRNLNSINEIRSLGVASERYAAVSREWNAYNRNVEEVAKNTKSRKTATQKKKLKAIASKKGGAKKALSKARGARGGLSSVGGLRGGSR